MGELQLAFSNEKLSMDPTNGSSTKSDAGNYCFYWSAISIYGAQCFSDDGLKYVQDNLRVLSGFYGILRPFDGIIPYRLGMGDMAPVNGYKNLYDFWGDQLYRELYKNNDLVISLASVEYEKAITPYLQTQDRFIKCILGKK